MASPASTQASDLASDAAQRLRQRKFYRRHRFEPIQQRGERQVERRQRSRQALGWDHQAMVDQASLPWQPLLASSRRTPGTNRRAGEDWEKAATRYMLA